VAAQKVTVILAKLRAERHQADVVHLGFYAAKNIHDITQPLGVIQRSIDNLRLMGITGDMAKQLGSLESAKNSVFEKLRDAAQGIELGEVLTPLGDLFRLVEAQGISIDWQSPELASKVLRTNIWLRSAVERLVENALEAAKHPNEICIGVLEDGTGGVRIVIENSGEPISQEDIQNMYLPGHSTKKAEHLGLGIPLAHFGITLSGGELNLEPKEQGGLRVMMSLPLASEASGTEDYER